MQTLNPFLTPILYELELFLNDFPLCNEYQIITHLQDKNIPPFDSFSLAHTKELFNAHFLCMHALYHLKNQYQLTKQFELFIHSVKIERVPLNNTVTISQRSKTTIEAIDPLEGYYLNPKHYYETQEEEISDMLKSFWTKYIAQDDKKDALDTLNLPANADAKMIKMQYLHLAQQHHPDKGGCADMFNKIRQAKTVLDKLY